MKGDVSAGGEPGVKVVEVACDVGVVVEAVEQMAVDRQVSQLDLGGSLPHLFDEVGQTGRGDVPAEPLEGRGDDTQVDAEPPDPAVVRVDRIDPRSAPERPGDVPEHDGRPAAV